MRILNKKQKKYLDQLMDDNPAIGVSSNLYDCNWKKLEEMGDHETMEANVERYISDRRMREASKGKTFDTSL